MSIARIENGAIAEVRNIELTEVPEHKRYLWLTIEYTGRGPIETVDIQTDKVVVTRSVAGVEAPKIISDRQFYQRLSQLGLITAEEALAAVGPGTIPSALVALIDALPTEEEKFSARMLLVGATQFDLNHPLVAVFALAFGWTKDQLNNFWIEASQL